MKNQSKSDTDITGHENRPEQDTKHETIVLEMYMINDEEAGVEKQWRWDDTLGRWIYSTSDESGECSKQNLAGIEEDVAYFKSTAPKTNSVTMTVERWKIMTDQES